MGLKLSASLIVKNEKDHIETVLKSIQGIDEIIVCDTGSIDNTVELAQKYTDKVYTDYKWNDDFAEARNHALSKCTGDWVLSIDADEFLEEGGIEKIRKIIENATNEQTSFAVKMLGGQNIHYLSRIFKNDGSVKWVGKGHETLSPRQDNRVDITITYGYSTAHKLDPDRMLRIISKQVEENPNSPREQYYLAREFFYRQRYVEAIWWFQSCVNLTKWDAERADAYLYLARAYFILQRGDLARDLCLKAIQTNPDFKEALLFMSDLHFEPWKSKWKKIADQATNKDVLFVRTQEEVKLPLDMNLMDLLYFMYVLKEKNKPRVLEWGSGYSTKFFAPYASEWVAVEHEKSWAQTVKNWNIPNVKVVVADRDTDAYYNQEGKYDVIFVDGRNRRKCLIKAKELLNPGGVVFLHDANREYYHSGFEGYNWKILNENVPALWMGTLEPLPEPKIPKIIHQIWIGPKKMPEQWMNTWKLDGFEYKLWTEKEIDELNLKNRGVYDKYYQEKCFNGCANIARTEILAKYGGVYIDADSICENTLLNASFMDWDIFSVAEADNFVVDGIPLVANGIIGCIPNHPLILKYIEEQGKIENINPSWRASGPLLWSKIINKNVLPAYTFLPEHHSGKKNEVTGKIYARQFWGTSKNIYE